MGFDSLRCERGIVRTADDGDPERDAGIVCEELVRHMPWSATMAIHFDIQSMKRVSSGR